MSSLVEGIAAQALGLLVLVLVVAVPSPFIVALLGRTGTTRSRSLAHEILFAAVLWVALETTFVCVLGWLGCFSFWSVVTLCGAAYVLGLWLRRHKAEGATVDRQARDGFGWVAALSWPHRGCISVLGATGGLLLIQLTVLPIVDVDSLTYLLPRVIEWHQTGQFGLPLAQFVGNPINSYPYTWNTLALLVVTALGHDQFVLLPNLVAWLIFGLAIYRLARLCGGVRTGCLGAATLAMLMPVGLINIRSAHVDLALAAFFLAAIYFTADTFESGGGVSAVMAGACTAMMLGTKMSGLPYAAIIAGLWVWLGVRRARISRSGAPWPGLQSCHFGIVAVLAIAASLASLSWYVHNMLLYGNPLGVVRVSFLGRVIWDGVVTPEMVAATDVLHNFQVGNRHHWTVAGRAAVAQLGLPGLTLLVGMTGAMRLCWRGGAPRALMSALFGATLLSFWLYLASPWSGNDATQLGITSFMGQAVRYGMPFLGLVGVLAGAACRTDLGTLRATTLLAGALLSAMLGADPWQRRGSGALKWQIAVAVFAGLLLVLSHLEAVRRFQEWTSRVPVRRLGTGILAVWLLLSIFTASALASRRGIQHAMLGGIARFVDRELPQGQVIGFWGTYGTALLYGTRLQHRLHYVPLDKTPTVEAVAGALNSRGLEILAVGPRITTGDRTPMWAILADGGGAPLVSLHGRDIDSEIVVFGLRRP